MAAHQRREAWSENCEKPLPGARELAAGWVVAQGLRQAASLPPA